MRPSGRSLRAQVVPQPSHRWRRPRGPGRKRVAVEWLELSTMNAGSHMLGYRSFRVQGSVPYWSVASDTFRQRAAAEALDDELAHKRQIGRNEGSTAGSQLIVQHPMQSRQIVPRDVGIKMM